VAVAGYLACAFDLINVRDLDLIRQARTHCSYLVAGVFSDAYVEAVTGRPPVVPESERAVLVSRLRGVDDVVVHDETATIPAGTLVFSVAGAPGSPVSENAVTLAPERVSLSAVLRDALRHQHHHTADAVA
jgi:hypothetical protein